MISNGFGLLRIKMLGFSFAGMLAVVFTAGGCGETLVYKQNKELRDQNRELQAKLDERNALRTESIPLTPPAAPASAVQPPIAQFNEPVAPTPPPITVGPSSPTPPTTDLGGEFTFDDRTGTATVNFMGDALFDSGKATLKDTAKKSLDKMVAALKKQYAGKPVKVNGHSDNDPIRHSKWKSNQELSEARAKAVRDYLVQKGVNASQVSFTGFGETHPKSATDKSKNRRVEIVVMTR